MKRSTNFKKFNLIERDELDRLRAKQIRDYSPVLSQLVTIKNEIDRVFAAPKLSPDDRVKILNLLHSRFDHIYKVLKYDGLAPLPPPAAGVLPPAMPPAGVPAAGVPPGMPAAGAPPAMPAAGMPAAMPVVGYLPIQVAAPQFVALPDAGDADEGLEPIAETEAHGLDPDLAAGPDEPIEKASEQAIATEPSVVWPTKQEMGITRNLETKYKQLTAKLSKYPHLINRNEQNEILLKGVPIAGSNFSDLISSLYRRNTKLNLKGEQDFINHLGSMGISPDEISTKESKALLSNAEFMEVPTSPLKVGTGRIKKRKSVHFKSPISSNKKLCPPPGKRPRILRVYQ